MVRTSWAIVAAAVFAISGTVRAAEPGLAGTWKVTVSVQGQSRTLWLMKIEPKEGKWAGTVTATSEKVPPASVVSLGISDGTLRFTLMLKAEGAPRFSFEGKVPQPGAQKVLGSMLIGRELNPAQLELTTLQSLDSYEVARDILSKQTAGPEVIDAATTALEQASGKKAKPEEVRSWADKALKAAEPYGPRMQRETTMRIADALVDQGDFAPVALEYARRAERLLEPKDKPNVKKRAYDALATALKKTGKADEAKEVEARIAKIEPIRLEPFAGRKKPGDRVVLVELFTGTQCPPCVAADLAFDALDKTYKPGEVVCLQYHEHIPGPDPLTNADSESRMRYYGEEVEGTPAILFNGKAGAEGGGGQFDAQDKYEDYQSVIAPLLETPAKVKLKLTASQKESKIEINAEVADSDAPGKDMRLRLVLVEELVTYTGGNRLPAHHSVVRAFPGGIEGLLLKEKTAKQSATVDLDELRKSLTKYLDDFAKKNRFSNNDRPLELKKLRVVAFVQNDATKEVHQAVQVDVKTAK